MSGTAAGPSAGSITVAETLDLLEGRFASLARAVADGRYALWLGSGISRERLPDVPGLVFKVLRFLHARMVPGEANCPYRKALEQAVALAGLREDERTQFEIEDPPDSWPVLDRVLTGLSERYSRLLDIRIEGEAADYLLWEAVDVRATYGTGIEPDCEHLCVGILVLEGVLSEAVSANWDGLIEAALAELAGDYTEVMHVVVLPDELRGPDRKLTLLKFHGCAVLALREPDKYRAALVGRRSQITAWSASPEAAPIRTKMVSLATARPTLMVGLSAQDENIQQLFGQARADMHWSWPADPPAHVFADDALGADHVNILRVVYGDDYDASATEIEHQALIRAHGKPLLTALVLAVLAEKLRAYLDEADAPGLSLDDREQLAAGVTALCHLLADSAEPDRLRFIEELAAGQKRALTLFQEGMEPVTGAGGYRPLGSFPADQVKTDPGLPTSGVRELAVALAVLGRGVAVGRWILDAGPVASGVEGALKLTSGGIETAVFFAANGRAAVTLQAEGLVDPTVTDAVIIHSTEPVEAAARSPRGSYGRTGRSALRQVDMYELLKTAPDLAALEESFRHEAAL